MLIAIHGFKQSGKDTLADLLVREYGFKKVAFADRLKEAIHLIFDVPREWLWGSDEDKQKLTKVAWNDFENFDKTDKDDNIFLSVRELMQIFATEVCRSKIPGIWYRYLPIRPNENLVVSDLRFANEAEFLKQNQAILIKVHRPSAQGGKHESEAGLPDTTMNHVLSNDADLQSFYAKGRDLFDSLGLEKKP
jgi:hypothetical protein